VSILYRLDPEQVPNILRDVGIQFERNLISPVFRSALADVSSRFMAKDMHTGMRTQIENEVRDRMMAILSERGFIIDAVLMKRIVLPTTLTAAIEEKLSAEQEAQRMQFILEREGLEAERKRMEAEGTRDAQRILSQGLTPEVLRYEYIEALKALATSPNAKVVITNGEDQPVLLNAN
jgi:regulator of protease activity HflC (stomatin/prohibitin superfamily)